ncbi:MAG: peptidylprolyl isomerase [Acidimicrobiia bacterium]|nr:peptidylprolyl isomerase [Acidimicrobiia bacterium]
MAVPGDAVAVHYTGSLDDGSVFDSSDGSQPLTFTLGSGAVIRGFDLAVVGLKIGSSKTVTILPEDGYGARDPERIVEVPLTSAPDGISVGDSVQFSDGSPGTVIEIGAETVVVDANHPLAGETLTFEIELIGYEN